VLTFENVGRQLFEKVSPLLNSPNFRFSADMWEFLSEASICDEQERSSLVEARLTQDLLDVCIFFFPATFTHILMHIHTYKYTCVCIHTYIYICMDKYMTVWCLWKSILVHTSPRSPWCMCTHTRTRICIHVHTYIYTCKDGLHVCVYAYACARVHDMYMECTSCIEARFAQNLLHIYIYM